MIRQDSRLSLRVLGMVVLIAISAQAKAQAADEAEIRDKIELLDDDSFAERQRAAAALLKMGDAAVPLLREAQKGASPERRARATEVLGLIDSRRIGAEFRAIGALPDKEIDVEQGMWAIALILDPEVTRESITQRLDAIAAAVRRRVGEGVNIAELTTEQAVAAVAGVLRDEIKLKGDHVAYDHPDNSSVHRVLEQKDGLPIVLSEIAVAVGRRLEIPITGIPVPGQYMIKFAAAAPENDVIVDPHDGWEVRTLPDVARHWGFRAGADFTAASTSRSTLVRMLNNLESDYLEFGNGRQARAVAKYRGLLEGTLGE